MSCTGSGIRWLNQDDIKLIAKRYNISYNLLYTGLEMPLGKIYTRDTINNTIILQLLGVKFED